MTWKTSLTEIPSYHHKYVGDIFILIGAVLGFVIGSTMSLAKYDTYTPRQVMYVGFPGEIFLNILRCMSLPMRIACLISAVGSMKMPISKIIGLQLLAFFFITKFQAAILGVSLALLFPAEPIQSSEKLDQFMEDEMRSTPTDRYLDMIRNLFPHSVVDMTVRQYETVLIKPENGSSDIYEWEIRGKMRKPRNMLGIVNYALIFGAAVATVGQDAKPVLEICNSITTMFFKLMFIFWRIAPLLIISLIASSVIKTESAGNLANKTALFTVYVIWGHAIQCWFVYPLLYFTFARKNPYDLMWSHMNALVTAYATSSSQAALPVAIKCLEKKAKINSKLVHFTLPIANALNKDGTAIYQAAAVVFFAKMSNKSLSVGDILSIVVLSVSASVASGRSPLSNVVGIVVVLGVMGLPETHVGLLLAIDWFIDHSATATNVLGDCILVGILAVINENLLASVEEEDEEEEEKKEEKEEKEEEKQETNLQ